MNPYLKRQEKVSSGGVSEKRVAKKIGARPTPASGAMRGAKGDMRLDEFLIEAKSTVTLTLPIDYRWLVKIAHEALNAGKTPAVSLSFTYHNGSSQPQGDWVMVPLRVWKEMTQ